MIQVWPDPLYHRIRSKKLSLVRGSGFGQIWNMTDLSFPASFTHKGAHWRIPVFHRFLTFKMKKNHSQKICQWFSIKNRLLQLSCFQCLAKNIWILLNFPKLRSFRLIYLLIRNSKRFFVFYQKKFQVPICHEDLQKSLHVSYEELLWYMDPLWYTFL